MSGSKEATAAGDRAKQRPTGEDQVRCWGTEEEEETGMSRGWSVQWDLTALKEARGMQGTPPVDGLNGAGTPIEETG